MKDDNLQIDDEKKTRCVIEKENPKKNKYVALDNCKNVDDLKKWLKDNI